MSRQQNPKTIQQTPSQSADVKPFSIRQYVNASRHKNIFNSWPFPDKYLQMCLNLGLNLNDVLPTFGIGFKASSNLMHSQKDSKLEADDQVCKTHQVQHVIEHQQNIKNECDSLSHAGYKEENINLYESADTFTFPTSIHDVHQKKAMKDKQDRRGRKKCKKRSMVDILAVARQCTLEDIYRINKFSYVDYQAVTQGCDQQKMMPGGDQNSFRKGERSEDHEAAGNVDVTEKGALVLKFKLNGCNVNCNSGGI